VRFLSNMCHVTNCLHTTSAFDCLHNCLHTTSVFCWVFTIACTPRLLSTLGLDTYPNPLTPTSEVCKGYAYARVACPNFTFRIIVPNLKRTHRN
jgi:hypothetical protein